MQITPEYTWNQDGGKIEVNAQFKAIDSSLVKSTRNYTITGIFFCFNAPPYLFQLDFEQEIDPFRIKIVLKEEGNVQFVFPKKDPRIIWDRLLTTKSKEERLMARMASVDRLRAKQQVLQVRRQKNKKIRYKAAQQRQWDEEKCLKKIINKLESDEKQQYTKKLKQWVVKMDNTKKKESTKKMDDTKSSDETKESSDDSSSTSNTSNNFNHYVNPFSTPKPVPTIIENIDKMGEGREGRKKPPYSPPKFAKPPRFIESKEFKEECSEPETNDIRQSNVVEVGFTEWDYVTPVREHSKPPEFALKSNVQSLDKSKSANGANGLNGGSHNESSRSARTKLEETSHICLCDKGIKFFENGDYQSAINAFTASIRRCPQFLQSYISRFQCYIELILATSDDLQYDERYISKDILQMQRIAQRYHGLGSMIIALQKGIIMTPILLDELRKSVDPTGLQDKIKDIRHSLKSPLKTCKYDPKNPMNARNWPGSKKMGIFRNPKTLSGLYDLALKCNDIMDIIAGKMMADSLMKEKRCSEAVERYTEVLDKFEKYTDDDCHSFLKLQCLNNRSTAWFVSGQFMRCIVDCDRLLALNKEHIMGLARRGASFLSLWKDDREQKEYLERALRDYEAAAKLKESYSNHVAQIKKILVSM